MVRSVTLNAPTREAPTQAVVTRTSRGWRAEHVGVIARSTWEAQRLEPPPPPDLSFILAFACLLLQPTGRQSLSLTDSLPS